MTVQFLPVNGSGVLLNYWADRVLFIIHIYKELIAVGLRVWVFRYLLLPNEVLFSFSLNSK